MNKYVDKIRILKISLQDLKDRYEETINRASRIELEIQKKRSRIEFLESKGQL